MPYPRELNLDEDTKERLISYLDDELHNHYAERSGHIDDLKRWQRDYWATPSTKEATFPFKGAATIIIPLSAIAIEAVHARTMTMMFALPQFVSANAVSGQWEAVERPFERFMDYELLNQMKIRKHLGDCFLEAEKFGTMIGKVGYCREVKTAVREIDGIEQEFEVVTKQGAVADCVPDSRFLMPYAAKDPQSAPWCGEEHEATPYELMLQEQGGLFKKGTFKELEMYFSESSLGTTAQESGRKFTRHQEELENRTSIWPKTLDWVEIWLAFDVDKGGKHKEIVVHYHRGSRTIMSVRYNWHHDLRRPYRTNVYFPIEHRWRGIGICKKNEQFQREVTTQHRQRLDNATLANIRMIKISKLSQYGPNEPVFPGKMWFVDDMDHIETLQLGEIYPSAYNNEQATLLYSQQRTGVNEVTLGMPQVGTPGTATSDLARIQEGNRKFDFVYQNFREFTNELIIDTAATIQQFGPRRLAYFDHVEGGKMVQKFFEMPTNLVTDGVLIGLRVVSQQQNKVLDRQNWEQVAARLQQYYTAQLQLAQYAGNPELMQLIIKKGLAASTEAMRQLLEHYDVRNIERLIVIESEMQSQNELGAARAEFGGSEQPAGPGTAPGIQQLIETITGGGAGGNGGVNRLL